MSHGKKPSATRPRCVRCDGALAIVHRDLPHAEGAEPLGYGYAATNLFCSLTCGHWYAVEAIRENRVTPKAKP